ncbi:hypothetical protein [Streptomyces sp. NPDC002187]|uniref:hypothetical protein n=1 Tax=Streptomyces sp. NPDC002187 TaxID=3364637 RepID=UPI0036A5C924
MTPDGLYLAIAAWIDKKRAYPGFLSVPRGPLPVTPVELETIVTGVRTSTDLARAAEFSLMANFVPRKGHAAQPFGPTDPLWLVHRETLSDMEFATQSLTAEEAGDLDRARGVLYTTDAQGRPTLSEAFLAYQEMGRVAELLEDEGAEPEAVQAAYADWLVLGHKSEVEAALGALNRLAGRSSRADATRELRDLQDEALSRSADTTFAPTYFAPLSAAQETTWAHVRISYAELRAAVPSGADTSTRPFLTSTADGHVEFLYAVLEIMRPWFSARLYQADDWRLAGDQVISTGSGVEGRTPAYPQSVYLARVTAVSTPITPAAPAVGGTGPSPVPDAANATPAPRVVFGGPGPRPPVVLGPRGPAGPAFTARAGVVNGGVLRPTVASSWRTTGPGAPPRRVLGRPDWVLSAPGLPVRSDWQARLERLRLALRTGEQTPPASLPNETPPASAALVIGFGCAVLPSCPHPNPAYLW